MKAERSYEMSKESISIIEHLMLNQGFEFAGERDKAVFLCKDGVTIAVSCDPEAADRLTREMFKDDEKEDKEGLIDIDRLAEEEITMRAYENGQCLG